MADLKISQLSIESPLSGSEDVEIVTGGTNKRTTTQAIANLATDGHVIEDEGTPLTQRSSLNFTGAGVTAADAGGKTVVTIPAGVIDGDKGDITVSASGATWTIDNGVVTAAKLAAAVDPIGIQDLSIPAAAMWPRTTNGCSQLTKTEIATSLINIQTLDFDQSTQEYAQYQVTLPRKFNNGTVTARFKWTSTIGSGSVVWSLQAVALADGDALTTTFGSAVTVADAVGSANTLRISAETSACTIGNTAADLDTIYFQFSRVTGDASDDLLGDAKLKEVIIHITVDAAKDA